MTVVIRLGQNYYMFLYMFYIVYLFSHIFLS